MDNPSSHKGFTVREMIEAVAANVLFLPTESPDFNRIENGFSKREAHLPEAADQTVDGLRAAPVVTRVFSTSRSSRCVFTPRLAPQCLEEGLHGFA